MCDRTIIKATVDSRKALKMLAAEEETTMIEMLEKVIEEYKKSKEEK